MTEVEQKLDRISQELTDLSRNHNVAAAMVADIKDGSSIKVLVSGATLNDVIRMAELLVEAAITELKRQTINRNIQN